MAHAHCEPLTRRDRFNLILGGLLLGLVLTVGWYTNIYGAIIAAIFIAGGGGRICWVVRAPRS